MDEGFESIDGEDDWDEAFAGELIGSALLIGLTHLDHDGTLIGREQVFGTVESADSEAGIVLRRHDDGQSFTIAPILDAIDYAEPGVYQLTDSDQVVTDLDFTALLTVQQPLRS
ncbi:hypothetical protein [Novosphingobium rosa]|uniref:hypothetical protein n=1 Tax=Novosphingobium rosa TaxID=76978 RepID=UPI00082BA1BD|nr:hypothetical protein [Novosphingobium rosa]